MPRMLLPGRRALRVQGVEIALAGGPANTKATPAACTLNRCDRTIGAVMTHLLEDRPAAARRLPGLTVVLPCFNEAPNVERAVLEAAEAAERNAVAHQIVVVDDGSTDDTASIAHRIARSTPNVLVVEHGENRGYGAALVSGLRAARMPWVLLTDGDLQFDLAQLEAFVPLAAEADLVAGRRIDRRDPLHRRANAAAWNWLVRLTFDVPLRDVDCAFKLIRRDVVDDLALTSSGAMISTELLVRAQANGARIRELGVEHRPRVAGEQSGADPRVVARAFRELLALRRELIRPATLPTSPAATA
jgi:glycosyltransferase involved in cell wall biosynthesis